MKQQCQRCKTETTDYVKHSERTIKNGEIKINYMCNPCNTKRLKAYRATKNGAKKTRESVYRSIKKHPLKQKARLELNRAVKFNGLYKPDTCSDCKKYKRIEGHHEDYSKPLEVIWVCRRCHFNIHKKLVK